MNCCLKSGIQKFSPNSRVHVQVIQVTRWTSAINVSYDRVAVVDLSYDRKDGVHARHTTAGHMWRSRGHFLPSASGFPKFSELLDATGFPVAVS